MALYWPEERVALDIIDDPYRRPFEGDESYTVLRVTCADLCDYDSYRKVMEHLCDLLGKSTPSMPRWEDKNRALHALLYQEETEEILGGCVYPTPPLYDEDEVDELGNVEILATSEDEGERMREAARAEGQYVRGVSVWDGPVPPGSFRELSDNMRMSTPEYFFLRKANQLSFAEAVWMGIELCGKFRTVATQYDRGEGYDFLKSPRTTKSTIRNYLREIRNTKEGKRAKRVLRYVTEECNSPMSCYLYMLLCLPRGRGSYGLGHAHPSSVYQTDEGFMPASSGDFLAYDLCWPHKSVAVQYVGDKPICTRDLKALQTEGMRVVCVSDSDIADPDKFDRIAQEIASLLDITMPEASESWLSARDKLRRRVRMPTFDHMLLTLEDINQHKAW